MTLNICIIGSAASIHVIKWSEYLVMQGHSVLIVSLDEPSVLIQKNIRVIQLNNLYSFLLNPRIRNRLATLIGETEIDLIQIHSLGSYALIGIMLNPARKLVSTPWGSDILLYGLNPIKKYVIEKIVARSDRFTCDSLEVKQKLVQLGAKGSDISVINFGINTDKFIPILPKPDFPELKIPFNSKILISTRSLEKIYDVKTILKAFMSVKASIPNVHLIIVGGGSKQKSLRKYAEKNGISKDVTFVGKVSNTDLVKYLNFADIYISAALSDAGIAASTAEAMSCKLVTIITRVRENDKWISDGINGFLFEPKNSFELGQKIKKALELDTENRSRMTNQARQTILSRNNFDTEMAKVIAIYTELCR